MKRRYRDSPCRGASLPQRTQPPLNQSFASLSTSFSSLSILPNQIERATKPGLSEGEVSVNVWCEYTCYGTIDGPIRIGAYGRAGWSLRSASIYTELNSWSNHAVFGSPSRIATRPGPRQWSPNREVQTHRTPSGPPQPFPSFASRRGDADLPPVAQRKSRRPTLGCDGTS